MNGRIPLTLLLLSCIAHPSAAQRPAPELDCLIEPFVVVDISSPVEGVLETVQVGRSQTVSKGQILATLEASVERAVVTQARARASMSGEVKAAEASLAFARRKLDRIEKLFSKEAVASHQKDEAETDVRLAQLELQQAREDKRLAELELEKAIEALNLRTIRSPIDGVVVKRLMAPGESVKDRPILTLAQIDPLKVEIIAPATMFGQITNGQLAEVVAETQPDRPYKAKVTVVDRIIDAASGTFGVRLELPNVDHSLPGGLNCRVSFLDERTAAEPEVIAAPEPKTVTIPKPQVTRTEPRCRTLGPVSDPHEAEALSTRIAPEVGRVGIRRENVREPSGYLLLAPSQRSTDATQQQLTQIRAKGFQDVALVPVGRFAGRVSLGMYSSKRNAERRREEFLARGVQGELHTLYRRGHNFWIDLELEGGDTTEALAKRMSPLPSGLAIMDRPCAR